MRLLQILYRILNPFDYCKIFQVYLRIGVHSHIVYFWTRREARYFTKKAKSAHIIEVRNLLTGKNEVIRDRKPDQLGSSKWIRPKPVSTAKDCYGNAIYMD